jgi:dihydroxyacetone kinase-like predicted kinase
MLRDAFLSAAGSAESHKTEVDALNVFPVPDGDTGTNMSMTLSNAARELCMLEGELTVSSVSEIAASALLRGARGNSGVILSLIFRGFAKGMKGMDAARGPQIAAALACGTKAAYGAVMKPTEGTILTVIRLSSEAAAAASAQNEDPIFVWDKVCEKAQEALRQTPDMLPVLKKAGVVDAGGQGLVHVLLGMRDIFHGGEIAGGAPAASAPLAVKGVNLNAAGREGLHFAYCSEFIIHKDKKQPRRSAFSARVSGVHWGLHCGGG